jgi:hypothetical protein
MNGVTDFGDLYQFNRYESGYSFFKVIEIPKFLSKLAEKDTAVKTLLQNYVHALEYEFRGLDGLDNITSETTEITDGISSVNVISKVVQQSQATVSLRYFEKSGSLFTKVHTMFLKGIKDPRSLFKTYHGLIESGDITEPGYDQEVFTFLYFVTDNTATQIEKAFLLVCGQPTKADYDMYNSEKGTIEAKEITIEFNCFPIEGIDVNKDAKDILDYMNSSANPNKLVKNSSQFKYTGVDIANKDAKPI